MEKRRVKGLEEDGKGRGGREAYKGRRWKRMEGAEIEEVKGERSKDEKEIVEGLEV